MSENRARYAMNRRSFLKLAGLATAAWAAQGCGPTPTPAPTEAPAATATAQPAAELESELNVLNWGAYIDHCVEPFEKQFNCTVNIEYFGSEDEAISKIQAAGMGVYDSVNLGVGYLTPAAKMGLLEPLDISRIPNYELLYDRFKPGPFEVDGEIYGCCYCWGTNAVMYNTELAPVAVDSWASFWDPQFAGWTSPVDKAKDQYLASMLYLGLDFNNPSMDDWPEVAQAIKDRAKLMKTVWTSEDAIMRLFVNGEVWLADMYDGLGHQIEQQCSTCRYIVPKEGTYGWFDGPLLVKDAPHPNLAYEWINFVISPEMAKLTAETVMYSPGNSGVPEMIDDDLSDLLGLGNVEESLGGLKFWENLGPEWDRRILDVWTEAKAGA